MDWEKLASVPLSYTEARATAGQLPAGYLHIWKEKAIGTGSEVFHHAAGKLMGWQLQRSARVLIDASEPTAQPGAMAAVGVGPFHGACRVIYVVDEPYRKGFAYGTLEGHPESGEEFFGVRWDPQTGEVYAQVIAFSKPGQWWSRVAAPIAALVQKHITNRYLNALSVGEVGSTSDPTD